MTEFESKEELLKGIEVHFNALNNGKLNIDSLENLVSQTRKLHERALILRYKAYEEKVFGEIEEVLNEEVSEKMPENQDELIAGSLAEPVDSSIEEIVEEEKVEVRSAFDSTPEPIFDFDLFEEKEETSIIPDLTENEEVLEDEINSNPIIDELTEDESFDLDQEDELIDQEEMNLETSTNEFDEEEPILSSDSDEIDTVFKSIVSHDDSLASRLMLSKLDSLIGSFGFNERFQTVQILFNNSNEDFNQALTVLDKMENFDEAKKQLMFYIRLHNWDLESQTAIDFIHKVQRRYS